MTVDEAVAHVKSIMGDDWPKMKPVPEEAIIPVCEALWAQGIRPNIHTFAAYFPGAWIRGFVPGITAWRIQRGFRRKARYPAIARIEDLAPHIAPEIAKAPFTCFDPLNDGRWPVPPARVIGYVRGIENISLRNTVALFTLLKDLTQHQILRPRGSFHLVDAPAHDGNRGSGSSGYRSGQHVSSHSRQ